MATLIKPLIALTPEQEQFLTAKLREFSTAEREAVRRQLEHLTPEDLAWLHCRLAVTRHDVNGKLLAINLAFELSQIRADLVAENAVRIKDRIALVEQELANYQCAYEEKLGPDGYGRLSARPMTSVQEEELADGLNSMQPKDRALLQGRAPHVQVELVLWLHGRFQLSRERIKVQLEAIRVADSEGGQIFGRVKDIEHELLDFTCEFENRLTFPDKSQSILPWRMADAKP